MDFQVMTETISTAVENLSTKDFAGIALALGLLVVFRGLAFVMRRKSNTPLCDSILSTLSNVDYKQFKGNSYDNIYTYGNLILHSDSGKVWVDGVQADLSRREKKAVRKQLKTVLAGRSIYERDCLAQSMLSKPVAKKSAKTLEKETLAIIAKADEKAKVDKLAQELKALNQSLTQIGNGSQASVTQVGNRVSNLERAVQSAPTAQAVASLSTQLAGIASRLSAIETAQRVEAQKKANATPAWAGTVTGAASPDRIPVPVPPPVVAAAMARNVAPSSTTISSITPLSDEEMVKKCFTGKFNQRSIEGIVKESGLSKERAETILKTCRTPGSTVPQYKLLANGKWTLNK